MAQTDDIAGIAGFLEALDAHGPSFDVTDAAGPPSRPLGVRVSEVRRRRGRLADEVETGYRDIALVERDGVLLWMDASELGVPRAGRRRGPRRDRRGGIDGRVLKEVSVPVLEPNEYLAALRHTDEHLNADCDAGLRVVRRVDRGGAVHFATGKEGLRPRYDGRTLLIVHGTFSSSRHALDEYAASEHGIRFLSDALERYGGQVLVFDHPTLSVSPFLNGLDLSRALAGAAGKLDVIAHSRGGVVVRWWLDVLGGALAADAKIRAVLAGCPLRGTSLAAPNRIQPLLSVLSNVGAFVSKALGVAAAANPFSLASFALLRFIVRREKNRWGFPPIEGIGSRPGTDAAVAVIPGLQGQSAVANNYELSRLRAAGERANVQYFALTADFEPERIGWKLWKVLTEFRQRGPDAVADRVFPAENDLVVDTAHMTSLADGRDIGKARTHAFGQQSAVHHCNYFRQPETIGKLREWLDIPEG